MHVYIVNEHTPTASGDTTLCIGAYHRRADAMRRVSECFTREAEDRGWDIDTIDHDHPESLMDATGGVIGDVSKDDGWIFWTIENVEVM